MKELQWYDMDDFKVLRQTTKSQQNNDDGKVANLMPISKALVKENKTIFT